MPDRPRATGAQGASPSVSIFGGGVGGLSAAQELIERGFRVTVYEKRHWGGKVRGMPVPGSGSGGRRDLPGQHGFHFFPGFYRNLPDTMSRIPSPGGGTVHDRIVQATSEQLYRSEAKSATIPASLSLSPRFWIDVARALGALFDGLSPSDVAFIAARMASFAGTCRERRTEQLDDVDWWQYIGADRAPSAYQRLLGKLLTSDLIAVRPGMASARTIGNAAIQWLDHSLKFGSTVDRLLDGPEQHVWVEPWVRHVAEKGAEMRMPAALVKFETDGRRITGAIVEEEIGGEKIRRRVESDHYICALPIDVARTVLTGPLRRAAPSLARLDELSVGWMSGVQFFLRKQRDLVNGHVAFNDSPWCLTAVSQAQFWPGFDWDAHGDGASREAFSVIVSEWDEPGLLHEKPAKACSREEIFEEVLFQINLHLERSGEEPIRREDIVAPFLTPGIEIGADRGQATNEEPLFQTTTGSWSARPEPITEIPNLFLASDWVRHSVEFASAEGTNHAARRAVNGILAASGHPDRVPVWGLAEPFAFAPMRALDKLLYRAGLPAVGHWGFTKLSRPPRAAQAAR